MESNYFYHLKNFIGEGILKTRIIDLHKNNSSPDSKYFKENFCTNPILKTFYNSSIIGSDLVDFEIRLLKPYNDLIYFHFISILIKFIEKEISENPYYKKELIEKLLSDNRGSMLTVFNELLIGGFLKFHGLSIEFNSSKQQGIPDIISTNSEKFANEGKLYTDFEFYLLSKLNSMKSEIINFLSRVKNKRIISFILDLDKFDNEFSALSSKFIEENKSQTGDFLAIINMPNYTGNQGYVIDCISTQSTIRFILNIDNKYMTQKLEESLRKTEKQFNNAEMNGIAWVLIPNPKEGSIERRLLLELTNIPSEYKKNNIGLVLYEFFAKFADRRLNINYTFGMDLITDNRDFSFINNDSFGRFIDEIVNKPVLWLV